MKWGRKNEETQKTRSDLDALASLLQRWVEEAFPTEHRSEADMARLLWIWWRLPEVIFGRGSKYVKSFEREMSELRRAGRVGDPPVRALKGSLSRAAKRGVREQFLVVAARLAVEQVASVAAPQAVDRWRELADGELPVSRLLTWTAEEFSEMQVTGDLTAQTRDAIALAREEARQVGDHDLDTAHLLLALLRQQDTVAVHTLEAMGVDIARLREDVESMIKERGPLLSHTRGSAGARALKAAFNESRSGARVTTGHILLGVMADSEGIAASVLAPLGLRLDQVRRQVKRSRALER